MSPSAPEPYYPESDDIPKKFDIEKHQIEVFRSRWDALWEYLERMEIEDGPNQAQSKAAQGA